MSRPSWDSSRLPSLNGRHDGRRILVPVAILRPDNPVDLTFVQGVALLDTGATSSGIGSRIIDELDLTVRVKLPLMVATEERLVDYFVFRIGLWPTPLSEIGSAPALPFVFTETFGFKIRDSKDFDVILGMDVLKQCDFSLHRNGSWDLKFGGP